MTKQTVLRIYHLGCLKSHPYYSSLWKKLPASEIDLMVDFIKNQDLFGKDEFIAQVLRMHLDKPRHKLWAVIEDLLIAANNNAFKEEK